MKQYRLQLFTMLILALFSCKKENNLYDPGNIIIGSYLTLTKENNTTIDFSDLANSTVSMEVGSKGAAVEKVNIYVSETATLDKTQWKLVKSVPFTEGVKLEVKATEIATALGTAIAPGSTYSLYNEVVTTDGRVFSSANMDTDFEGQAGYNMAMSWTATTTCPYDQSVFDGSFSIVKDTWQDYAVGDLVEVKAGPGSSSITIFVYPSPAFGSNRKGVVLTVDGETGNVSIPEQIVGDYGSDKNITMQGVGAVNSCQGTITLTGLKFKLGMGGADYGTGTYQLTLKKS
ncbi:MAG TPA: hypothetical protein VM187_06860 [Niastella sp.]|nr:hypothetical protein [Niastella sp.]